MSQQEKALTPSSEIKKDHINKLKSVITQLEEDNNAAEFKEPVPWRDLGLQDYPQIIKKPMDLGTCKKNLLKNKYATYQAFLDDLQLIWDNCKTYNVSGSSIYQAAEWLEKQTKKFAKTVGKEIGLPDFGSSVTAIKKKKLLAEGDEAGAEALTEVSFEEKVQFSEKVRRLNNEGLTKLVKKVQEICAVALEDVDDEKLQIRVDQIDRTSFDDLTKLVDENLKRAGKKKD